MDRAVAAGEMNADRANQAKSRFDTLAKDLPAQDAQKRVVQEASDIAAAQRRRLEANAAAQRRGEARIDAGRRLDHIVEDFSQKGSLRFRHESIRAELRGVMNSVLKEFRSDVLGRRRNKARLKNVVLERYGQDTGDKAAKELAQSYGAADMRAKELFEVAGGYRRSKSSFGLPMRHSQILVGKTDPEKWVNIVLTKINLNELTDDLGNSVPKAAAREALLRKHEHIAAGGWVSRERSQVGGEYTLSERSVDPDFLPFKSGEAWIEYAELFSEQRDPWRAMVGHIDAMAHQIAEIEVLGVDADATWEHLKNYYLVKNKGSDVARGKAGFADTMRENWQGVTQEPGSRIWARRMSNVRQYLSATQLGSAFVSSLSDFPVSRSAAAFAGLNRNGHLEFATRLLSSKQFRDSAREMGLILENAVDMGVASHRYSMEDFTTEGAARLSDFTMRTSLLSGWTQISKDAVGMSALKDIADMKKLPFDQLPLNTQRAFDGFGMGSDVWDQIRKTETYSVNGLEFIRPLDIEKAAGREAALSVMEFVNALQNRSILSSSNFAQSMVRGSTRPGTIPGELLRTIMQYKSFPVEFILRPIGQFMQEINEGNHRGVMDQAFNVFVLSTLLGAMSYQMKEVSKGREPKDMNTTAFWMGAGLQGGGLGIFGDFLFADHNRFGGGLLETFSGPTIGLASDVTKLTVGNIQQAVQGEDMDLGKDLIRFGGSYAGPVQSLWYTRLIFEREVEDRLMRLVDDGAAQTFRRKKRKAEKEGSGYWWGPGQSLVSQ